MYESQFRYRKCLECSKVYKQNQGTLAMGKKNYNICPYCGGKTELEENLESMRKEVLRKRRNRIC